MMFLVLSCLSVALAHPDPAKLFEPVQMTGMARMPIPAGGQVAVSSAAREQGALIMEEYLAKSEPRCLARAMCQYGARKQEGMLRTVDYAQMTIKEAWESVTEILQDAYGYLKEKYEETVAGDSRTSNINQILGAMQVGEAMGYDSCRALFECSEDFFPVQEARITCEGAGKICPGFSIGCALCGLYAPAVCGSTCTVAALYCGFGGYACAAAAN